MSPARPATARTRQARGRAQRHHQQSPGRGGPSAPRPSDPGAAVASPADPARPPAALSTARRPLSPALEAARLPADIYDGLKARDPRSHCPRHRRRRRSPRARGSTRRVNPTSGAFGLGQWLGSSAKPSCSAATARARASISSSISSCPRAQGRRRRRQVGARPRMRSTRCIATSRDFMRPGAGPRRRRISVGHGRSAARRALPEGELGGAGGSAIDVGTIPRLPGCARRRSSSTTR
jgi:hypothetical protein